MSYCGSKNSKTELSVEPLDSHIDLFDLLQGNGPAYDQFAESNTVRLYGFLDSMIHLSGATQRHILSESMIKAINFHAIAFLHDEAGQYRTCNVCTGEQDARFALYHRVPSMMREFVDFSNWSWKHTDPYRLAAYALWRITNIHPFIDGNGRTARAVCHFILSMKGIRLSPANTMPLEKLRDQPYHDRCVRALQHADRNVPKGVSNSFNELIELICELTNEQ